MRFIISTTDEVLLPQSGLALGGGLLQQTQLRQGIDALAVEGYDAAGNRAGKMNAVAHDLSLPLDELYEYDQLARLVAARRGLLSTSPSLSLASVGFEQAWGLDGLGNFATFREDSGGNGWDLEQQRDVNAANEIIGIDQGQGQPGWITPEYDAAGNMISGPAVGGETARGHFVYDAWNRLRKVYADDGDGQFEPSDGQGTGDDALIAAYQYDGAKRRIEKATTAAAPGGPRAVEYYYNTNWQLLEERAFDAFSQPVESHVYVWSPRYIDSPVLRDRYDAEGELDPSARVYYLGDANFNVTALVGLVETAPSVFAWQVAERYVYDPYGRATVCSADWTIRPDGPDANTTPGDESAFGNAVLYSGYRFDAETGLYHVRHPMYHATVSTWTSRDPLGYAAGDVNLYRYCAARPILFVDPTGLKEMRGKTTRWSGRYVPARHLVIEHALGWSTATTLANEAAEAARKLGMTSGEQNFWAERKEISNTLRTAFFDDIVIFKGHKGEYDSGKKGLLGYAFWPFDIADPFYDIDDIIHDLNEKPGGPAILVLAGCDTQDLARKIRNETSVPVVVGTTRTVAVVEAQRMVKKFLEELPKEGATIAQVIANVNADAKSLFAAEEPRFILFAAPGAGDNTVRQLLAGSDMPR